MLTKYLNSKGLVFAVNIDGHNILFKEWDATDDCIYYFPLATLVDNGDASCDEHECTVPFESIYLLDQQECDLLGIPLKYDKAIRLRGDGMLNSSDFTYKLELLTHATDGQLLIFERSGNVVDYNDKKFLLNEYQYELFNQVEDFNQLSAERKTTDENLRRFATIKRLAQKAGCELDSYLANENVYIPEKIKLEVGRDENGFTVKPSVDIVDKEKFTSVFEKTRRVQGIYPIQNEQGERTRVVLNQAQMQNLEPLKEHKCHFSSQEEMKQLIDNPTEFFDPDQFDLSEFYSDRVIEIGLYKPKFYPFVCPYKSCWIVGAKVESPQSGTSHIKVEDEDSLTKLKDLIEQAEKGGHAVVTYRNTDMGLDDARYLAQIAEKQLQDPKQPVKGENKGENKVLIIEENAEELGFAAKELFIETGEHYILFNDPYLQSNFPLKEHQQSGVAWLQHLYKSKASGCLMANDMGLGKTLQILYFIDWHSRTYPNHKPYLIVAPISLLENWKNEYKRFFAEPRLNIVCLTSTNVPRLFDRGVIDKMQHCDMILTNYDSLRISQLNFCAVEFDVVALDEAQKIKSPGTLVTNAAKALKGNFKIAMTGTPVENSLLDRMRTVSEHPYLYDETIGNYELDELIDSAARLKATMDFMNSIKAKDEKVIIFTDRKETQKMLQRVIFECYGMTSKIINGDTPSIVARPKAGKQSRQSAINEFQLEDGFNVIIMSPVAAGMGLNVTAANHVIHYSRHWNPAKESQATDRAYRIGQTKDVYVYYPIAVSKDFQSFDKTLDELLSRKSTLATSTIFPSERIEVKQDELGQMLLAQIVK